MADAEFVIDARQFQGLQKHLDNPEFMRGPARAFIERGARTIDDQVTQRTPIGVSGLLKGGIATEFSNEGLTARVGTNRQYAPAVEFGSRPHWAPLGPLLRWVQVKGLGGRFSVKTRRRLGNKFDRSAQDVAMARAIQRKIGHKGTKGQHMFGKGLAAARPIIEADAAVMLAEIEGEFRT